MKKLINVAAGIITGAILAMSASGAVARDVNVRINERPVYEQGRPHHAAPRHYSHYSHYSRYDRDHRRPVPAGMRRDRDRDGVPNRYDRAPGNPYRY